MASLRETPSKASRTTARPIKLFFRDMGAPPCLVLLVLHPFQGAGDAQSGAALICDRRHLAVCSMLWRNGQSGRIDEEPARQKSPGRGASIEPRAQARG